MYRKESMMKKRDFDSMIKLITGKKKAIVSMALVGCLVIGASRMGDWSIQSNADPNQPVYGENEYSGEVYSDEMDYEDYEDDFSDTENEYDYESIYEEDSSFPNVLTNSNENEDVHVVVQYGDGAFDDEVDMVVNSVTDDYVLDAIDGRVQNIVGLSAVDIAFISDADEEDYEDLEDEDTEEDDYEYDDMENNDFEENDDDSEDADEADDIEDDLEEWDDEEDDAVEDSLIADEDRIEPKERVKVTHLLVLLGRT